MGLMKPETKFRGTVEREDRKRNLVRKNWKTDGWVGTTIRGWASHSLCYIGWFAIL